MITDEAMLTRFMACPFLSVVFVIPCGKVAEVLSEPKVTVIFATGILLLSNMVALMPA